MSLLEERIKRSSRKTFSKPKQEINSTITMTAPISSQKENSSPNRSNCSNNSNNDQNEQPQDDEMEEEESLPPVP